MMVKYPLYTEQPDFFHIPHIATSYTVSLTKYTDALKITRSFPIMMVLTSAALTLYNTVK